MHSRFIVVLFPVLAVAAPPFIEDPVANHEVAEPFAKRAAFPGQVALSGWSIFRRQGCPNLSLLCPSGVCCSYAEEPADCCGKNCCASGYLCTGGTASNPCCVAISDMTNTCGSVNSNPCITPGYLPCSGVNFCCPPNSSCYVDNFNVPRCAPRGTTTSPTPTPTTPRSSPSPTPIPTTPRSSPSPTPIPTTPRTSPSTTPVPISSPTPTPIPQPDPAPYHDRAVFWTPATIGGIAAGSAVGFIILILLISCCIRKLCGSGRRHYGSDGGNFYGQKKSKTLSGIQPLTDRQIAALVQYRDKTNDWQALYIAEAERISADNNIDRVAWLVDFATRAVEQRHSQLRNGGRQLLTHLVSGIAVWIPHSKLVVGPLGRLQFTHYALKCFGMFDKDDVNELYLKAFIKAGVVTTLKEHLNKLEKKAKEMGKPMWLIKETAKETAKEIHKDQDLQADLLNELYDLLKNEMGQEAATEAMADMISWIPLFGHAYGVYRTISSINGSNTRINKSLSILKEEALDFHLKVFVVNAY